MTHLEILKDAFNKIGVLYIEKVEEEYITLYLCTDEEQKTCNVNEYENNFFEFCNGSLASYP